MTQPPPDQPAVPPAGFEPPAAPQQPYPGQPQGYQGAPSQYQGYQGAPPQYQQPHPQGYPPQYMVPPGQPMGYGYPQPKSRIAAGLFGIFLGGLGIHRFYLGYTGIGILQLILTLVLVWFTFGLIGLWGLIEGIMILAGAAHFQRDARGMPLRD